MDLHRARPRRRHALLAPAPWRACAGALAALSLGACAGGSFAGFPGSSPAATSANRSAQTLLPAQLVLPPGFHGKIVANVGGARELAALPNGDLIVGTTGKSIVIVPNIDGSAETSTPATFATFPEGPAEGVSFGGGYVFAATEHAVWRIPYATGAQSGTPQQIAAVRTGSVAPNSDGDVHHSTSVAFRGTRLEVGVGSSCNACAETDPTRATVQAMNLDGSAMQTKARRFRNPIAMALDPERAIVWAGGAGQDNLAQGHPYEFLDPVSTHPAPADYGWPACEENHVAYTAGADCGAVVVPAIEFPAYSTLIGAAYYGSSQAGAYAFPAPWRGGLFVSAHGSWHTLGGVPAVAPHVAFVPFTANGTPTRAVNWSDPTAQWNEFLTGFQNASGSRIGRPSGVAVGPNGSLFVADDQTGNIYRIRPNQQ
jgi:glucose/arabinose dehydrogenase